MDITEALRKPENRMSKIRCTDLMDQAAAEIERLRTALNDIACLKPPSTIAKAALGDLIAS